MQGRAEIKNPKYNSQLAQSADCLPHFFEILRN